MRKNKGREKSLCGIFGQKMTNGTSHGRVVMGCYSNEPKQKKKKKQKKNSVKSWAVTLYEPKQKKGQKKQRLVMACYSICTQTEEHVIMGCYSIWIETAKTTRIVVILCRLRQHTTHFSHGLLFYVD